MKYVADDIDTTYNLYKWFKGARIDVALDNVNKVLDSGGESSEANANTL